MAADKQDKVLNFSSEREQSRACSSSAEREKNQGKNFLNVPNLRFPEFTDEWKICKVGDYGKIITGSTPPTSDNTNYAGGTQLWASPVDLGQTKFVTDTQTKLSSIGFSKTRKLPVGSVLVTCIGSTIGKMGMTATEMSTNQQINSIVVDSQYDNHFVYYALQSRFPRYLTSVAVQAVPIMSKSSFEKLQNYRTTFKEQKKIGALLNLIDERISTQIRIIDKLKSLMKGLNDYLQNSVPLSYSLSFSDIGEDYSGLSGKSAEDFGSGKPYITYVSIYANCFVDDDSCGKVSVERGEKQNVVQKGDMLFTLSSETPEEVCYGAVYSGNSTETYLNSFCFGIRNTEGKVFSPYMAYFFNSNRFRREVYPLAQGSTRFNLQKSDFLQKQFSYPSIDDQHRIFKILNAYDNKLKVENQILAHYQHQKEFLLRNLFI